MESLIRADWSSLECEIYLNIISAFEQGWGIDIDEDPFIYLKIVEIMGYISPDEIRRAIVANALVLILYLYFQKSGFIPRENTADLLVEDNHSTALIQETLGEGIWG